MVWLFQLTAPLYAQETKLLPPPIESPQEKARWQYLDSVQSNKTTTEPLFPENSRADAEILFRKEYDLKWNLDPQWNGHVGTCQPGTTSQKMRDAELSRINYFRTMVGLPHVRESIQENQKATAGPVMLIANQALSHDPPDDWLCATVDARHNAITSNIVIGPFGPRAIDGYMSDPGSSNAIVGHRRHILNPTLGRVAMGDAVTTEDYEKKISNTLQVFGLPDDDARVPRPAFPKVVLWPSAGYLPVKVFPGSRRWSLSIPNADFTNTTIEMTKNGSPIEVNIAPLGRIGDAAIVWQTSLDDRPDPIEDTLYSIKVSNISAAGVPSTLTYQVHTFQHSPPLSSNLELPRVCGKILASGFTGNRENLNKSYKLGGSFNQRPFYENKRKKIFWSQNRKRWEISNRLGKKPSFAYNRSDSKVADKLDMDWGNDQAGAKLICINTAEQIPFDFNHSFVSIPGEVHTNVEVKETLHKIYIRGQYKNPIVIVGPPSSTNPNQQGVVRVKIAKNKSWFGVKFFKWNPEDVSPVSEHLTILILEAGDYFLEDGRVVAGSVKTDAISGINGTKVIFSKKIAPGPWMYANISSIRQKGPIFANMRDVSNYEFTVSLQPSQNHPRQWVKEKIHYLALSGFERGRELRLQFEPSSLWLNTQTINPKLTDAWYRFEFNYPLNGVISRVPRVFSKHPITLRAREVPNGQPFVDIRLQSDTERSLTMYSSVMGLGPTR